MTPAKLRASLDRLGLSQVAGARLLRIEERTMRRWCAGATAIPFSAWALLCLIEHGQIDSTKLDTITGYTHKDPNNAKDTTAKPRRVRRVS
jgi:hypothetical protein